MKFVVRQVMTDDGQDCGIRPADHDSYMQDLAMELNIAFVQVGPYFGFKMKIDNKLSSVYPTVWRTQTDAVYGSCLVVKKLMEQCPVTGAKFHACVAMLDKRYSVFRMIDENKVDLSWIKNKK